MKAVTLVLVTLAGALLLARPAGPGRHRLLIGVLEDAVKQRKVAAATAR